MPAATGVMVPIVVPKERATIDQEFINTQPAGQSIFESHETWCPATNFTNRPTPLRQFRRQCPHPRLRRQPAFRSLGTACRSTTTGKLCHLPTGQVADLFGNHRQRQPVNQGTTDVDSPTASAVGGVIAITTTRPKEEFGALFRHLLRQLRARFANSRASTAAASAPGALRAFASYSYSYYDKWKGPGYLQKRQYNAELYQDLGATGWISLAVHYNENRKQFSTNSVTYLPSNASTEYVANAATRRRREGVDGHRGRGRRIARLGASALPMVALTPNGSYTGVGTPPLGDHCNGLWPDPGTRRRFARVPHRLPARRSSKALSSGQHNALLHRLLQCPHQIRPTHRQYSAMASLFHLTDELSLTFDPSIQYVLANGGGITGAGRKTIHACRGANGGPSARISTAMATCWIRSRSIRPTTPTTIRYGLNTSLLWQIDKGRPRSSLAYYRRLRASTVRPRNSPTWIPTANPF